MACAGDMWMDCMAGDVNKGKAVRTIQESLGIKTEETMAFGDQLNDIEMLNQAFSLAEPMPGRGQRQPGSRRTAMCGRSPQDTEGAAVRGSVTVDRSRIYKVRGRDGKEPWACVWQLFLAMAVLTDVPGESAASGARTVDKEVYQGADDGDCHNGAEPLPEHIYQRALIWRKADQNGDYIRGQADGPVEQFTVSWPPQI